MDLTNVFTGKKENLTVKDLLLEREAVLNNVARENVMDDQVPGAILNQNLGHNSKKEGLGPNTKR